MVDPLERSWVWHAARAMPPFLVKLSKLGLLGLAAGAGFGLAFMMLSEKPADTPDPAALVEQIREVARLET